MTVAEFGFIQAQWTNGEMDDTDDGSGTDEGDQLRVEPKLLTDTAACDEDEYARFRNCEDRVVIRDFCDSCGI